MLITGVVLALLAAVLLTRSAIEMSRANSGPFPAWSNPPQRPRGALVSRAAGAGLAVLGGAVAGVSIGYWAVLVVVLSFVGALVVMVDHNRRVAAGRGA